jgi:putative transposase
MLSKQEAVYLTELQDGFRALQIIEDRITFYNSRRPHYALGHRTPA